MHSTGAPSRLGPQLSGVWSQESRRTGGSWEEAHSWSSLNMLHYRLCRQSVSVLAPSKRADTSKYLCSKLLLPLCHSICSGKLDQNENLTSKYWASNQQSSVCKSNVSETESTARIKQIAFLGIFLNKVPWVALFPLLFSFSCAAKFFSCVAIFMADNVCFSALSSALPRPAQPFHHSVGIISAAFGIYDYFSFAFVPSPGQREHS